MQTAHVSFSDFYIEWLMTINEVMKLNNNPFTPMLTEALTARLFNLRTSMAFKTSLYIDPRFNYLNSTLFNPDDKQEIQNYIIGTWKRISHLKPIAQQHDTTEKNIGSDIDEFDLFLTEMFGGTVTHGTDTDSFVQQIKALDIQPRQNHGYNVWQHWIDRKDSHPELYSVAMVVLAVPSNQVSVERAFSALGLILTNLRTGLGDDTLANILMIKLNKKLFEQTIPTLYVWNTSVSDPC
ncbi:uncharacterized protein LOC131681060 [Topomyia yanbarensis]|uniref:uncharacterized protein LOC131681060 n=1 Tax=Topomyia yanbarensis TaxID=2498891 RepID=UPI00273B51E6|nr:uncharacterized protein LOC131681060 [Topomyia yanbarensis]